MRPSPAAVPSTKWLILKLLARQNRTWAWYSETTSSSQNVQRNSPVGLYAATSFSS